MAATNGCCIMPSPYDLARARELFEANEPRDLFYRAATELIELAMGGKSSLGVAEALAVLLQTWNARFYQYRRFNSQHFADIEALLERHATELQRLRTVSLEEVGEAEVALVGRLFEDFEMTLGPVGAAKSLHLLAPRLFPLWDRAIAHAYGLELGKTGTNASRYCQFLRIAQQQCERLGGTPCPGCNLLKAPDEYNYCRFTKDWL